MSHPLASIPANLNSLDADSKKEKKIIDWFIHSRHSETYFHIVRFKKENIFFEHEPCTFLPTHSDYALIVLH